MKPFEATLKIQHRHYHYYEETYSLHLKNQDEGAQNNSNNFL